MMVDLEPYVYPYMGPNSKLHPPPKGNVGSPLDVLQDKLHHANHHGITEAEA
jgi:hypothetical protein